MPQIIQITASVQARFLFLFIPRPTKWGRGYWRRLGCPAVRISFPEQHSVTRAWISLIFDTHPLGGVDVPFGVFEILPA